MEHWKGFKGESWKNDINVRDFIQKNYKPYEGDSSFLEGPTKNTLELMANLEGLYKKERENGVLDVEQKVSSSITAYKAGYIDQSKETIVGLQTDAPLKRAIFPKGGINMMRSALKAYGYELDKETDEVFSDIRKTHNQGVFDVYTDTMKKCRKSGIITGLPDAYGRGRIIGDYRRVALYGVDKLIADKKDFLANFGKTMDEKTIRLREETSDQIKSLMQLKEMALEYGFDISQPAKNAKEAIQWLYFGYLAATKEQNGAAMSIGRTSSFLDIYIQRDLDNGTLTEQEAQEMIDHFVMKLRIIRFLRTPDYNDLFSGDPTWVTESLAGMGIDGRTLVTKNSFRILQTLYNLGPAPEPNLTVLWSPALPRGFKEFASKVSYDTSSIQYENDDLMRPDFGDDYGIACCVSPMKIGKQMQFFGARVNLAKALLYAINGGKDELSSVQVAPRFEPVTSEYLDFDEIMPKFDNIMEWLAEEYVKTLSVIHYMHDKYFYEALELSLHDHHVERMQATGIAGLSVVADSLSAIKNAKVKVIRNAEGLAVDYEIEGSYVAFGNNDNDVDSIAADIVKNFMKKVAKQPTYRESTASQSILTITSNVVYGLKTGSTPDGRKAKEPFAPGANPMHGRDTKGAVASLASIAKLPFEYAKDGISYTWAISPAALGKVEEERIDNLISLLDGYFVDDGGQHLNVNVFDKSLLEDAMAHPENYPQLTIRVSGYAVNFIKLTKQQQLDVISRTISSRM